MTGRIASSAPIQQTVNPVSSRLVSQNQVVPAPQPALTTARMTFSDKVWKILSKLTIGLVAVIIGLALILFGLITRNSKAVIPGCFLAQFGLFIHFVGK